MSYRQMCFCAIGTVVLNGALLQPAARGQCDPIEIAELLASDGEAGDWFGASVFIRGDSAIVGAHGEDDRAPSAGAAYIFERIGGVWIERAKLIASDGAAEDQFGISVSLSGDLAIVGAQGEDRGSTIGAAYIFERIGAAWVQSAKLLASDGAAGDFFGVSVSISGGTAIVGAPFDDDHGANSGSAYIFERVGGIWTQTAKLVDSNGEFYDWFGSSVSVDGDTAFVGVHGDNDRDYDAGSAYVYEKVDGVWTERAKLLASDGEYYDRFGNSVSLSGDTAVIGALFDDDRGSDAGSAYIFERVGGAWIERAKLLASDGTQFDEFGRSVFISGDRAIVGAIGNDDLGSLSGSAYIFEKIGGAWVEQAKLLASDGEPFDNFGWSVAVGGDSAIVGALTHSDPGSNSGAAYVFDLNCGPALRLVGSCPGTIEFVVEGATPNGRIAFLYARGLGGLRVPDGNPCAGALLGLNATARLGRVVRADANGAASLSASVPPVACGRVFVQGLDIDSCATTNVIRAN